MAMMKKVHGSPSSTICYVAVSNAQYNILQYLPTALLVAAAGAFVAWVSTGA